MCKTISTAGMDRETWLRLRKTGIGGSDAGAICGVNPYSSSLNVYLDKLSDQIEDTDNESMRQGRDLEEYVARRFMEETGLKVRRSNKMYRSNEYPFMLADVDRLIVGQNAGLECKTANAFQADQWKNGEIPAHYLIQCLHYMAVTGRKEWYIAVVILGWEFKYQKITWDNRAIQKMIEVEKTFWNQNIVSRKMPEPDGSDAYGEAIGKYFSLVKRGNAVQLVGFDEKLERRKELLQTKQELEKEQKQIEQEIQFYMKDNETAFSDGYRITWANVDTSRLDTKRIKEEKPEIYQEFSKTVTSRRFQIKAA